MASGGRRTERRSCCPLSSVADAGSTATKTGDSLLDLEISDLLTVVASRHRFTIGAGVFLVIDCV